MDIHVLYMRLSVHMWALTGRHCMYQVVGTVDVGQIFCVSVSYFVCTCFQKRDLVEEARSARVYKDEAEALKLQVGSHSRFTDWGMPGNSGQVSVHLSLLSAVPL